MIDLSKQSFSTNKITGFDWDKGNIDKSYEKHGIKPEEAEQVFLDVGLQVERSIKHEQKEKRFIAIGEIPAGKILFIVFTMRNTEIRVVSARVANKTERRRYAEAKKNTLL